MNTAQFDKFSQACSKELATAIGTILENAKDKEGCLIGFITTDDFYGCHLTWDYSGNVNEYFNWKNGLRPNFLYQPLVDVVEECEEIDFCRPSTEKWAFAKTLLSVLEKNIKEIPDELFTKNGFKREDILFFSTMSAGDYTSEMIDTSVKTFNTTETLEKYGIK
ncbi:hypothetical protein HCB33_07070 [Listeria sp. FSL L7-0233]|uniref:hypothetical protein n=1 Tax=Listeria cossartiae TaxID=2838249 RepID=UPI001629C3EF|nr:hypothetical protein [Listeria cossartiae]MBC2183115.1 hypothetical protein [Listeria cossartiae subsp. cossartiae]MBC2185497.1 hypothetical protein [Listeria cossartiae subsp. cossartiae]MBC2190698.1 hypothetical protein [Listeria cossartiae subsp. cossartiae]